MPSADEERGTLKLGEPHPSSEYALKYIKENCGDLFILQESLSSCAIEGNRIAEICGETLDRLITGKPVSDRYVMGLAWFIYEMNQMEKEKK